MSTDLAIQKYSDGWASAAARTARRIIRGTLLKHVDGRGTIDGQPWPEDRKVIVVDVAEILQCFMHGEHIESHILAPGEPVDLEALNSRIPEKEWDTGLDNKPRPPWQLACAVYLLDERNGEEFPVLNSTWGMRRAFDDLVGQVENVRKLHGGAPLVPIVTIGSAVMKTRYGQKLRPSFRIEGLKGLAGDQALLKPVEKPTASEIIGDTIDDNSPPPTKKKPKSAGIINWDALPDDDGFPSNLS